VAIKKRRRRKGKESLKRSLRIYFPGPSFFLSCAAFLVVLAFLKTPLKGSFD
jgi:hypothetical protein